MISQTVQSIHEVIRWDKFDDFEYSLSQPESLLILAVTSAYKRDRRFAARWVREYLAHGGEPETLNAATALLLSSRGRSGAAMLFDMLDEMASSEGHNCSGSLPGAVQREEAADSDSGAAGVGIDRWGVALHHVAPEVLTAYLDSRTRAWNQDALPERVVHLILVAINSSDYLADFALHHARLAMQAGASVEDAISAAALSISVAGITAWFTVGSGLTDLLEENLAAS